MKIGYVFTFLHSFLLLLKKKLMNICNKKGFEKTHVDIIKLARE